MSYRFKWKPSRTAAREFARLMDEIDQFCIEHGISASASNDSYYFTIRGQKYRVSNHAVESSPYHPDGRRDDTVYIHASKTRIIEIYNDLVEGRKLNGRGERI